MNSNQQNQVFKFSAVVLLITAFAKLYSSAGSVKILAVKDPLLHLGYRPLLISVSVVEIVVAIFIVVSSSDLKRCIALLWLSGNFLFYHLGNYAMGIHLCPCLGNLTDRLPLPKGLPEVLLQVLVLYWFLISINMLWRGWGSPGWKRLLMISRRILPETPAPTNRV